MRNTIAYSLGFPERLDAGVEPLNFSKIKTLTFEEPDLKRFPQLGYAYDALKLGGAASIVLNAANEIAVAAFIASLLLIPLLGTAFIPEMKEGSVVPGINRVPNISLDESIKMEMQAMKLVMEVPGVKSAISGVGRGESPADPQGQNESTPIVSLKPRDEWPAGWTQDDITDAMREKLKVLPGAQVVMAQPISDRVDEMVTGVRSDVAVKVFGDDLDLLKKKADEIARVAAGVAGATDIRVERITGQQYLSVEIDRVAIARHGLNVSDVNDVIEAAIGGKQATEVYEGERRFASVVRLPESFRDNVEKIGNVLVNAPDRVFLDRGRGLEPAGVRFTGEAEVRRLAVRLAARLRGTAGAGWRFGLANMERRAPASVAQITKQAIFTRWVLMPMSRAACGWPPVAKIQWPKSVRRRTKPSTIAMTIM